MRIACPTCAAAYDVPDALLAAGPRQLRCARCGTAFPAALPPAAAPPAAESLPEPAAPDVAAATPAPEPPVAAPVPAPEPPAPESAAPESAAPEPAAPELTAPPRERPPPTRGPGSPSPIAPEEAPAQPGQGRLAAAWIGSFAVIGAGLFALLHWQAEIAATWPPAARLYAALGLS